MYDGNNFCCFGCLTKSDLQKQQLDFAMHEYDWITQLGCVEGLCVRHHTHSQCRAPARGAGMHRPVVMLEGL